MKCLNSEINEKLFDLLEELEELEEAEYLVDQLSATIQFQMSFYFQFLLDNLDSINTALQNKFRNNYK